MILINFVFHINIKRNSFNLVLNKNFIKYFSGKKDKDEWDKLLGNLNKDANMDDDLKNSIEQIVSSFREFNNVINQSTILNQGSIRNITREEDDPNVSLSIEEEQNILPSNISDNINLEGTGTVESISSLSTLVDVNVFNSNNVLEFFTIERLTNSSSLASTSNIITSSHPINTVLPTTDLGEQANICINEVRETMETTIIHFNNIINTKQTLLNKMQQQSVTVNQNLTENIQNMASTTRQAYEQAQSTIDNISNPDNLGLFTTIFNFFANHLPIKLITYTATGLVGVTLLICVGKYVLKYNLLASINTTPSLTTFIAADTTHASFFSRIGDRIIKLFDLFVEHLNEVKIRKYK
jgi:hypothetical protein